MKSTKFFKLGLAGLISLGAQSALANHINPNLGIAVSLYSSDGAGNFTLQVDEYLSPYGDAWVGAIGGPGAWDATFAGPNLAFSVTGATVTGPTTGPLGYQGIENNTGTTFYSVPSTTWAVNIDANGDTTDAAKYTGRFNYHITGYDPAQTYSLTATVSDCCTDVPPPDLIAVQSQTTFNPATEVAPVAAVPVPAAFWLFGSGLYGLFGLNRKAQRLS